MIRRIDDKPKLVNPSGWISEGRMPTGSARDGDNLAEPEPTRSRSSNGELEPIDPTLTHSPEPTHSQLSVQQESGSEAESESELEDLSEIPRRGRHNRRVSDRGAFPHRKSVSDGCIPR